MLVELCGCNAEAARSRTLAAADAMRLMLEQLGEIVGARKERAEIDRVLDRLAMSLNDAGRRELRDGVIMALARGARRSGGRLGAGTAATGPGELGCWRA